MRLIKNTLGPGNPGGVESQGGRERYKDATGDKGTVYEQPGTEVDDSYHDWRVPSKYEWGSKGKCRVLKCAITCIVYMLNDCSDKKIPVVHITIARMNVAMYIMTIGMNVVANLNSV